MRRVTGGIGYSTCARLLVLGGTEVPRLVADCSLAWSRAGARPDRLPKFDTRDLQLSLTACPRR